MRVFSALLAAACLLGSVAEAQTYRIQDLGVLGDGRAGAIWLPYHGRVRLAGPGRAVVNLRGQPWLVGQGGRVPLGALGGTGAVAYDATDDGTVVGEASTGVLGPPLPSMSSAVRGPLRHAVLWRGGRAIDLHPSGTERSAALTVNRRGEVGIVAQTAAKDRSREVRAYLWRTGSHTYLGKYTGVHLNNAGDALLIGSAYPPGWRRHRLRSAGGAVRDLGLLRRGNLVSLNGARWAAGTATIGGQSDHACVWRDGRVVAIQPLPGRGQVRAYAINDRGQVVGWSTSAASMHAFIWRGGQTIDLNDRVGRGTGWVLETATDIDDSGAIAGIGTYRGRRHAFLLTPAGRRGQRGRQ